MYTLRVLLNGEREGVELHILLCEKKKNTNHEIIQRVLMFFIFIFFFENEHCPTDFGIGILLISYV